MTLYRVLMIHDTFVGIVESFVSAEAAKDYIDRNTNGVYDVEYVILEIVEEKVDRGCGIVDTIIKSAKVFGYEEGSHVQIVPAEFGGFCSGDDILFRRRYAARVGGVMIHIKDLQNQVITEKTESSFKILSGYVNGAPFGYWYAGECMNRALRSASEHWESKKKELYGPNTYVETVRNGEFL